MTLARLAIDTGYETSAVYAWSRQVGFAQVAPVKGVEGSIAQARSPARRMWMRPSRANGCGAGRGFGRCATSTFKTETYRFCGRIRPTREEIDGWASLPAWNHPSAKMGGRRVVEAIVRPNNWSRCARNAALPDWSGRSYASAMRRWTAGFMREQQRGYLGRIAGQRRGGWNWSGNSQ